MEGIIPAVFTPYNNNKVSYNKIDLIAKWYYSQGIRKIFVCGTSGEFPSLTLEQRKLILLKWCGNELFKSKCIIHVGSDSVSESKELAKLSEENNAFGIASVPPYYFGESAYKSEKDLALTMLSIASSAPNLPFWYYHIPEFTHICDSQSDKSRLSLYKLILNMKELIPNFRGIKFTSGDENLLKKILTIPNINIAAGNDKKIYEWSKLGVRAFIGTSFNLLFKDANQILDNFKQKDFKASEDIQNEIEQFFQIIDYKQYHPIAFIKQLTNISSEMNLFGYSIEPLKKYSESEVTQIYNFMRRYLGLNLEFTE